MKSEIKRGIAGVLLCAGAGQVTAAGFAIIEHSAQGMGNAFAGGGAVAEDASTVWFNPASMSRLESQAQASGHVIRPSFTFRNSGSTAVTGAPLLSGIGGSTPGIQNNDGGSTALVPNMYYVRKFNEQLTFGLAINAPFGLATEYDDNWIGRYKTIDSEIINLNVNPALSFKVNDKLSMGAGVSINYVKAKLTKAVDFAGACIAATAAIPAPTATCVGEGGAGLAGIGQGGNDGFAQVKGDDISFGYNLGLMYEINDNSRLSVAFRSEIKHELDGKATFRVPATISSLAAVDATIRGAFANDGVSAGVRLPASLSFSAYHRYSGSKFAVMADATWTGWSAVPGLLIVFDKATTAGGPTEEPLGWKDTWRLGLGLNYHHSDRITLRTGVAWDQSPVPSPELRTPRLPGNDRTWLSLGASYSINDRMSADIGYAHLFVDSTKINHSDASSGTLTGSYKSDVDIFSVQFSYKFH